MQRCTRMSSRRRTLRARQFCDTKIVPVYEAYYGKNHGAFEEMDRTDDPD